MPDRTHQTFKDAVQAPEMEILGPETAGALVTPDGTPQDATWARHDGRRNDSSGVDVTLATTSAAEAARAVSAAAGIIDFGAVRPGPALAGMRDVIDDDAADALRTRRREAVPAQPTRMIENGVPSDVPLVEGPARAPNTLPAIIGRAVVGAYDEWASARDDPRWLTIYDLPGYRVNSIRALGRTTFRMFPCFTEQERRAAQEVGDPLGEIAMMVDFSGRGPSRKEHLDRAAGWLRQNGTVIDATVLEFPGIFDGYRPEIILTLSEDRSYLMVRDSISNGAPVDGLYIYSWKGGMAYYRSHLADADRVAALLRGAARHQAIAGPANRPGRAAVPALPSRRLAAIAPPATDPSSINLGRGISETGKAALAALPSATSPADRSTMVSVVRSLSFRPAKDASGRPVFRRQCPDGSTVDLEPDDGMPLARSASFKATVRDACGNVAELGGISEPAKLDEIVRGAGRTVPQARP